MAYSKAKFKCNDDRASPCFRPFWIGNVSVRNFVRISHLFHACYMLRPSHAPWPGHSNNVWWSIQLLSSSFCSPFQTSAISSVLGPYSPQHPILTHNLCCSLVVWETKFHTQTKRRYNYNFVYVLSLSSHRGYGKTNAKQNGSKPSPNFIYFEFVFEYTFDMWLVTGWPTGLQLPTGTVSSPPHPRPTLQPTQHPIQLVPGLFSRQKSGRDEKLITHLQLVPRLRIPGAVPPFSHTSSWLGAQLHTQTHVAVTIGVAFVAVVAPTPWREGNTWVVLVSGAPWRHADGWTGRRAPWTRGTSRHVALTSRSTPVICETQIQIQSRRGMRQCIT
jgi:hypothetical protein